MTDIQPLSALGANYNAVQIKINDPKTLIPEGFRSDLLDTGIYNAVNVEVNRPMVEVRKDPIYHYPESPEIVTFDKASFANVNLPQINTNTPAYDSFSIEEESIDDGENTLLPVIDDVEDDSSNILQAEDVENLADVSDENIVDSESLAAELPVNESEINTKKEIEIIPPVEIKPEVDISDVTANLSSPDYDVQALQMYDISKAADEDPEKFEEYIKTEVFTELIDIIKKDTSMLAGPSEAQTAVREKIKENIIAQQQAYAENKDLSTVELPNKLTDEDYNLALSLSPKELAERNKDYALSVTAKLAKAYADGVEKENGTIVPLTDLPGSSAMVDVLRRSKNPDTKIASIYALMYISRPEYNEELFTLFSLARQDENPEVAQTAALAAAVVAESPENFQV